MRNILLFILFQLTLFMKTNAQSYDFESFFNGKINGFISSNKFSENTDFKGNLLLSNHPLSLYKFNKVMDFQNSSIKILNININSIYLYFESFNKYCIYLIFDATYENANLILENINKYQHRKTGIQEFYQYDQFIWDIRNLKVYLVRTQSISKPIFLLLILNGLRFDEIINADIIE